MQNLTFKTNHIYSKMTNKEYVIYGEIIITKNNFLKIFCWQENYNPLKQSEQIDSLIRDYTFLDEKPKMLINMKGFLCVHKETTTSRKEPYE